MNENVTSDGYGKASEFESARAQNRPRKRRRSNKSARMAGTRFETSIAAALSIMLDDDRIERRAKTGAKDKGDIGGVRCNGRRIVIECKNTHSIALPQWTKEAHTEAINDGALVGVVVHKRHGNNKPKQQWVSMTLEDLAKLIAGHDNLRELP